MRSDLPFLEDIRQALNLPKGQERTKHTVPTLFDKTDKNPARQLISKRTFQEKQDLIEIFGQNCASLGTKLHIAESLSEAEDITVEIVRSRQPEFSFNRHIVLHDHPDIAAMQLWKRFNRESVTVHTTFSGDSETTEKTIASYIGITAPSIIIAESGTLVQITSPGCPRSTSLVPSIHIALIRSETLVADLKEAYCLLEELNPQDSYVFISGPSKTADIEAHLVHGAHGPKEVHVILVKEEPQKIEPEEVTEVIEDASEDETDKETAPEETSSIKEETEDTVETTEKL
jgi:L-lactate dehydrogenase complex protein LldG